MAADRLVFLLVILAVVLPPSPSCCPLVVYGPCSGSPLGAAFALIVVRRLALRLDDAIVERITGTTERAAVGAVTSDVFQDLRNATTWLLVAAILIGRRRT